MYSSGYGIGGGGLLQQYRAAVCEDIGLVGYMRDDIVSLQRKPSKKARLKKR